jgi:hypothetical protein
LSKLKNQLLRDGNQEIFSNSSSFQFLEEDIDLYSVDELKEKYK